MSVWRKKFWFPIHRFFVLFLYPCKCYITYYHYLDDDDDNDDNDDNDGGDGGDARSYYAIFVFFFCCIYVAILLDYLASNIKLY